MKSIYLLIATLFISFQVVNSQTNDVLEFPFMYSPKGYVYVNLNINDKGNAYFLFDVSGNNFIRSDQSYRLSQLGIDTIGLNVKIGKLEVAGFEKFNLTFNKSDYKKKLGNDVIPSSVIGGLGYKFLKGYVWQINYKTRTIKMSKSTTNLDFSRETKKMIFLPGLFDKSVSIEADINSQTYNFVVSTGWPLSFSAPSDIYKNFSNLESVDKVIFPTFRGEQNTSIERIEVNNVNLGEVMDLGTTEVYVDMFFGYVIGNKFLENYIVTVDWDNFDLYLDPNN